MDRRAVARAGDELEAAGLVRSKREQGAPPNISSCPTGRGGRKPMAEIVILPRTLLYLNQDTGAGVCWDRREGLLVRGPDGAWGRTTEVELRRAPRIHERGSGWLDICPWRKPPSPLVSHCGLRTDGAGAAARWRVTPRRGVGLGIDAMRRGIAR